MGQTPQVGRMTMKETFRNWGRLLMSCFLCVQQNKEGICCKSFPQVGKAQWTVQRMKEYAADVD
jgi:hypothetical protein